MVLYEEEKNVLKRVKELCFHFVQSCNTFNEVIKMQNI